MSVTTATTTAMTASHGTAQTANSTSDSRKSPSAPSPSSALSFRRVRKPGSFAGYSSAFSVSEMLTCESATRVSMRWFAPDSASISHCRS